LLTSVELHVSLRMLADYLAKEDSQFSALIRGLGIASPRQEHTAMTDLSSTDPLTAMEARLRELPEIVGGHTLYSERAVIYEYVLDRRSFKRGSRKMPTIWRGKTRQSQNLIRRLLPP
jgi:hypothetical protein